MCVCVYIYIYIYIYIDKLLYSLKFLFALRPIMPPVIMYGHSNCNICRGYLITLINAYSSLLRCASAYCCNEQSSSRSIS